MAKFKHSSLTSDLTGQMVTDGTGGSVWKVEGNISDTIADVKKEREARIYGHE